MSETEFARAERLSLEIYFLKQKVEKLEKVVEAARYASREINGYYLGQGPHDENLWYARDQIDLALRELDGENG